MTAAQCAADSVASRDALRCLCCGSTEEAQARGRFAAASTPRAQRGDETLRIAACYAARFSGRSTKERPPTASLFAVLNKTDGRKPDMKRRSGRELRRVRDIIGRRVLDVATRTGLRLVEQRLQFAIGLRSLVRKLGVVSSALGGM